MTLLMRRDPFEVPTVGRLFSQMLNDPFFTEAKGLVPVIEEGTLALDVSEDEKNVYVRASLPGFSREDVDIEVHDGVLTIKGEHSEESETKNERYYRKERRVGSVSRRLALPSTVVEDAIKAELKDGVLTLTMQKVEKEQPRKIKIG